MDTALSEDALLRAWETAQRLVPVARSLALLSAASGEPIEQLAALPLGERDRRLIALRAELYGTEVRGVATCAFCDEELELAFDAGLLPGAREANPEVRQPTTFDLVAAAGAGSAGAAYDVLVHRWLADDADARTVGAVEAAILDADPGIDTELAVQCSACAETTLVDFDAGAYAWSEIESNVQRLFATVAALARHYGWSEHEILAMSAQRREAYLALAFA
jgi:hypothetical protein